VTGGRYAIAAEKNDPTSYLAYAVYGKGSLVAVIHITSDQVPPRDSLLKLISDQYDALP
jgi:hypothetical protein